MTSFSDSLFLTLQKSVFKFHFLIHRFLLNSLLTFQTMEIFRLLLDYTVLLLMMLVLQKMPTWCHNTATNYSFPAKKITMWGQTDYLSMSLHVYWESWVLSWACLSLKNVWAWCRPLFLSTYSCGESRRKKMHFLRETSMKWPWGPLWRQLLAIAWMIFAAIVKDSAYIIMFVEHGLWAYIH